MHLISFVNMFRNNQGYHEASLEKGGGGGAICGILCTEYALNIND